MTTSTQTWRNILFEKNVRALPDFNSLITEALQSQYSSSPKIKALCLLFQEKIDATTDFENLLSEIMDPSKAKGIFLDWWGHRMGVPRNIEVNGEDKELDDDTYRFLIFYKAASNISDATSESINKLLSALLGLPVFVIDNLDMTIGVRVLGRPTDLQIAILQNYGLLTRGAGVGYQIVIQNPETAIFGFNGSGLMPFNQGVFNPSRELEISNYE